VARKQGFTLIEVLITAAIVATLASIALPLSELAAQRSKETELRRALQQIRDAFDAYKRAADEGRILRSTDYKRAADEGRILRSTDQSGYPPTLVALVDGATDAKSPSHAQIYFLRRIPRDPLYADTTTPAQRTWGMRSYESPPNDPKPGKDVFDVYSLSARTGLNGIPYKEW
jgi:general secretion pathway protein G